MNMSLGIVAMHKIERNKTNTLENIKIWLQCSTGWQQYLLYQVYPIVHIDVVRFSVNNNFILKN